MSGYNSNMAATSSILEFVLLNNFSVKLKLGNAPRIKEVLWKPPIFSWIKCNINGASIENPGPYSSLEVLLEIVTPISWELSLITLSAELQGAIIYKFKWLLKKVGTIFG